MHILSYLVTVKGCEHPLKNKWLDYYGRFGNIFEHELDCKDPELNIKTINDKIREVKGRCDVLVVADIDEFVVPDPDKYTNLLDYINKNKKDVVYGTGYEVLEVHHKPLDLESNILSQCDRWWYYHVCNKPVILTRPVKFVPGKHYTEELKQEADSKGLAHRDMIDTIRDPDLRVIHFKRLIDPLLKSECRARPAEPINETSVEIIPDRFKGVL